MIAMRLDNFWMNKNQIYKLACHNSEERRLGAMFSAYVPVDHNPLLAYPECIP
jgi:hypothetical protein